MYIESILGVRFRLRVYPPQQKEERKQSTDNHKLENFLELGRGTAEERAAEETVFWDEKLMRQEVGRTGRRAHRRFSSTPGRPNPQQA